MEISRQLLILRAAGIVFTVHESLISFGSFAYRHAVFVRGLKVDKVKPSLDKTRITSYAVDQESGLAKVGLFTSF